MDKQPDAKKHRGDFAIGIAASVVASILITICKRLFDELSNVNFVSLSWIEDTIYSRAARITPYSTTLFLISFSDLVILAVLVCTVIFAVHSEIVMSRCLSEMEAINNTPTETISQKTNECQSKKARQAETKEALEARLSALKAETEKIKQEGTVKIKSYRLYTRVMMGLLLLMSVVTLLYGVSICESVRLRGAFEQELYIISPYVDEQTISQVKSSWVLMKTKDDFTDIYNTLEDVHAEYHINGYERDASQQDLEVTP